MAVTRVGFIKKSQKESLIKRKVSELLVQAALDYPELRGFSVTRVTLSANKQFASIFLYSPNGVEEFKQKLPFLKLFAPSLRKALSREISGRYTPEIKFWYDAAEEKQQAIEQILDKIKSETPQS